MSHLLLRAVYNVWTSRESSQEACESLGQSWRSIPSEQVRKSDYHYTKAVLETFITRFKYLYTLYPIHTSYYILFHSLLNLNTFEAASIYSALSPSLFNAHHQGVSVHEAVDPKASCCRGRPDIPLGCARVFVC